MSAWTRTLPLLFVVATTACPGSPPPAAAKSPRVDPAPPAATERAAHAETPEESDRRTAAETGTFLSALDREQSRPEFFGVHFTVARDGPFVVFQEVNEQDVRDTIRQYDDKYGAFKDEPVEGTTNPAKIEQNIRWAAKAGSLAQREATLLGELDRRFRGHFADRFKLPTLQENARCVSVFSMWNREHFERVAKSADVKGPKDARGGRLPESHDVLTYLGDEFLLSEDEIACADGRWQKTGDQELLALAARELLSQYAAVSQGRPPTDVKDAEVSGPLWFIWGLADWLAAVEAPGEKLESPLGTDLLNERIRLDHVKEARANIDDAERWKLRDLMKPTHIGDGFTLGEKLAPGSGFSMTSLFRCRAWAFCHFLWNYDDGKYSKRLGDFLGLYLAGEATSARFATEIMKRPNIADWGEVEMEFEWYWAQLLERKVGRSKVTHAWATPTTTPPEGTVEQDAGFLTYWKERNRK